MQFRKADWLVLEQEILKTKTDGKRLTELTSYRDIALWWFIRFRLYHSEPSRLPKSLIKNIHFISFVDFLYDFFTSILCRVLSRLSEVKTGEKRKLKVLITAHNTQWKNVYDVTGRLKKTDAYFDSVITELKKQDYDIVTVYPLGYSISEFKTLIDKLRRQKDVAHRPFNVYWSVKIWKKSYDASRHFRNIWRNILEKNGIFIHLLETCGLRTELSYCFNSVFERAVKNIDDQLSQMDVQSRGYIENLRKKGAVQQLNDFKKQLQQERARQTAAKSDLLMKIEQAKKLVIGTEFVQGPLEGPVEVKIGDNLYKKVGGAEIIVKDGVVQEIRGAD